MYLFEKHFFLKPLILHIILLNTHFFLLSPASPIRSLLSVRSLSDRIASSRAVLADFLAAYVSAAWPCLPLTSPLPADSPDFCDARSCCSTRPFVAAPTSDSTPPFRGYLYEARGIAEFLLAGSFHRQQLTSTNFSGVLGEETAIFGREHSEVHSQRFFSASSLAVTVMVVVWKR